MTWNNAYLILNALVIPGWFLLIAFPKAELTRLLVHSIIYPLVIGIIYITSLAAATFFGVAAEGVGFSSLESVALLFDHPNGVITGWSHYLVFDLFVGAWIGRDAQRCGFSHLVAAPTILATYIFGPLGLVTYCIIRFTKNREAFSLQETQ